MRRTERSEACGLARFFTSRRGRRRTQCAALLLGAGFALTTCGPGEPPPAGTVIVNARVLDGSGDQSRDVNVRIEGDRIAAVGDLEPAAEDTVVDADGLVLAPGFIDVHSHHDSRLFELPEALAAVNQGITTIVAGQDGGHQYPLAEFFAQLETSPAAVNVASYAGFGTFREEVMGEDYQRHATPDEVAEMKALLRTELEAGALGLSSGLEYDPGSFSATEEVVELARLAASHGGTYISHIRSEDRFFWEAIEEIIRIGREADLPVQVTHMKLAMNSSWGQAERLLSRLDEARASGVEITADIYPYRAWSTSFAWLTTVFPDRDLDRRDGAEYILRDLLSPDDVPLPRPVRSRAQRRQSRGRHPEDDLPLRPAPGDRGSRRNRGGALRRPRPVRPRDRHRPFDLRGPASSLRGDREGLGQRRTRVRRRRNDRQPARQGDQKVRRKVAPMVRGASRNVLRLPTRSGVLNVTFFVCSSVTLLLQSSTAHLPE